MFEYILVYYMLVGPAAPASALPVPAAGRYRSSAVSVQERFESEALCRQRIEAVKTGRLSSTTVPSERFELACHPVPLREAARGPRTS